jgi:hypothetical protein
VGAGEGSESKSVQQGVEVRVWNGGGQVGKERAGKEFQAIGLVRSAVTGNEGGVSEREELSAEVLPGSVARARVVLEPGLVPVKVSS